MKDTTLKSLSERIDLITHIDELEPYEICDAYQDIWDYNDFLKKPLKLEMFIPCKDEVPLEEPNKKMFTNTSYYGIENKYEDFDKKEYQRAVEEYQKALDRVIFKGFELLEINEGYYHIENNKIIVAIKNKGLKWSFNKYESIQDLVGKVQLTDKQHELLNL